MKKQRFPKQKTAFSESKRKTNKNQIIMAMKLKPKPKAKEELIYEQSIKDFRQNEKKKRPPQTKTK